MYRQTLLTFAVLLLAAMGFIHSYLGEKYMFSRLFAIPELPLFRKNRKFTERVLRFAWHITSLAWWGFAGLLFLISINKTSALVHTIAIILAMHGIMIVGTCGIRHPAWSLFLLAACCVWLAA